MELTVMIWIALFLLIILLAAYFRWPLIITSVCLGVAVASMHLCPDISNNVLLGIWIIYLVFVITLNVRSIRQSLSVFIFKAMRSVMPTISQTEQDALDAGDVWWEAEIYRGIPDFSVIHDLPKQHLTEEEQAFIDGPVVELCEMVDDWKITNEDFDPSPEVWKF